MIISACFVLNATVSSTDQCFVRMHESTSFGNIANAQHFQIDPVPHLNLNLSPTLIHSMKRKIPTRFAAYLPPKSNGFPFGPFTLWPHDINVSPCKVLFKQVTLILIAPLIWPDYFCYYCRRRRRRDLTRPDIKIRKIVWNDRCGTAQIV